MSNQPEGTIKSTYLPEDVNRGAKIFLSYEKGWYVVHLRYHNLKRMRSLAKAEQYYNDVLSGKVVL